MASAEVPSARAGVADPVWPDDAVEVGRVLGAWGIKGWLKVLSFTADANALLVATRWLVQSPEGVAPDVLGRLSFSTPGFPAFFRVVQAREHGGMVVAQVDGVADRTQAETLRGVRLFLSRAHFPPAKAGEYYWIDLIGLSVVNREGQPMGQVVGLIDTGPHSVLRLMRPDREPPSPDGAERLIPFVTAYVDDVDLAACRITVDWGLDY